MAENEAMTELARYIAQLEQQFPALKLRTLRPITHSWDSFVLEVNEELMFRFPLRQDVQASLQREIHLLPRLAPTLAVPVPHFRYIGQATAIIPSPFVGYPTLRGVALQREHLSAGQAASLVPARAAFLDALHRFPPGEARRAGVAEHTPEQWRARYQQRYLTVQRQVSWMSRYVRGRPGSGKIFCKMLHAQRFSQYSFMVIWQASISCAIRGVAC